MTVWVVYTEWNRGFDLEGGVTFEGVYLTEAAAKEAREGLIEEYRDSCHCPVYGEPVSDDEDAEEADADWGADVHIEECEVQS